MNTKQMDNEVLFQAVLLEEIYDNKVGDIVDILADLGSEYYYENPSGTSVYLNKEDEGVIWKTFKKPSVVLDIHDSVISGKSSF